MPTTTVADNRSIAGSRNHHHQIPQVAKTNQEKLQNSQQSTGVHCPKFQVQKQRTDPSIIQILSPPTSRTCSAIILVPTFKARRWLYGEDTEKSNKGDSWNQKPQLAAANPGTWYHQPRTKKTARTTIIEVFKCLNRFTYTASARGLFDYDLNDKTKNNGAKLIVKHFNSSVAQHF